MKKFLLLVLIVCHFFNVNAAIKQIRWGSGGDPLNGLTITWSNNGTADKIAWGYSTYFEKGEFAAVKRTGYASGISFFKYVFPTVTASTTIYYKLYDSQSSTWTAEKTFETAPPSNSTNFTFCALGDSRANVTTIWKQVADQAYKKKVALSVYNGDVTSSGNSGSEYDTWFTSGEAYLANNIIYHALGNHDSPGAAAFYQNIFELPKANNTNLYYATKYGNAIFITLNSESPGDAAQLSWLKTTLADADKDPAITWKILSFHKPLFNIGDHAGEMNSYRSSWWKAFDDYGVDLILTGHDHNYQRSKPINLKTSPSAPVAKYGSGPGEGRCQIICGGAGAPLYPKGDQGDAWATNTFNQTYNYVYLEVKGCKMIVTAYKNDGTVLETFNLDKTGSAECSTVNIAEESTAEKFNSISVYPNPTIDEFTLNYSSENKGEAIIKVYDFNGKEVISEKTMKTTTDMQFKQNMAGYAKGIYTVSVIVGNQRDNTILILR
jgi:hypothetical protein